MASVQEGPQGVRATGCLTSTIFAGWRRLFLPVHLLILPPLLGVNGGGKVGRAGGGLLSIGD